MAFIKQVTTTLITCKVKKVIKSKKKRFFFTFFFNQLFSLLDLLSSGNFQTTIKSIEININATAK